jgi:hypothetical protein
MIFFCGDISCPPTMGFWAKLKLANVIANNASRIAILRFFMGCVPFRFLLPHGKYGPRRILD